MSSVKSEDVQSYYEKQFQQVDRSEAKNFAIESSIGYQNKLLNLIHPEKHDIKGFSVLDLGSGLGRDVFLMSSLVGNEGNVVGVDMSQKVVDKANSFKAYHKEKFGLATDNVIFRKGNIEDLSSAGIEDSSVDIIISNCVVNLAMEKRNVFKEAFRVLRDGGEMLFSDIYTNARLSEEIRADKDLWGACYSGALYVGDFLNIVREIGFTDFYIYEARLIKKNKKLRRMVKVPTNFYSITCRLFKVKGREVGEESYGQYAKFLGDKYGSIFDFGYDWKFLKGEMELVSGNVANILKQSKYGKFFEVSEKGDHRGSFSPRNYASILSEIELKGEKELNSACCADPDGSGCCDGGEEEEDDDDEEEEVFSTKNCNCVSCVTVKSFSPNCKCKFCTE